MDVLYTIEPLSNNTIEEATRLVHNLFPYEAKEERNPGLAFKVSLNPEQFPGFLNEDSSDELRYFVAVQNSSKEVIGTTGLYHVAKEPWDTVWLGWYCVKQEYRGKGIGRALLQYVIDIARREGRCNKSYV